MCSDGEVGKDNAIRGHNHWKDFVNSDYLKQHQTVPFVECIGISADHDADVLDGFIIDDAAGNYCKSSTPQTIRNAFENAQNETMGRSATKIQIEFPLNVTSGVYKTENSNTFTLKDLIVTNNEFSSTFWISLSDFDQQTAGNDGGLHLIVNGKQIAIKIKEVVDEQECQYEAIAFYEQILKDMLHTLRNITNAQELELKAKEIESELQNEYIKIFESITAEPVEKQKLQNEIKELLVMKEGADGDDEKSAENVVARRAELMKRYKQRNRMWKQHRRVVCSFQDTLACLKNLVREIILGQVRMQEIRQHVLDLHFAKKHAKRLSKLVLTDEQLASRQAKYDDIETPTEEDCKDIDDEVGSGCYLSTLSKRECVLDADPLWICGRVNRIRGVAVSNPELIKIDYVSPDLVSDSYFKMALEATEDSKGFGDSCRQLINCRLFPIYANMAHMKCSKPYLAETLSHTLSGRTDIRVADYNCLLAFIGYMVSRNTLSHHNMKRLFTEIVPSYKLLTENMMCKAYNSEKLSRETMDEKIKLAERNRLRLVWYTQSFKARTTALVSAAQVLFADRLMNMEVSVDDELYLSIILQRMRGMFSSQIPKNMDEVKQREKVVAAHKHILQILICGHPDDDDANTDDDDEKEMAIKFDTEMSVKKRYKASFVFKDQKIKPAKIDSSDDVVLAKWDVKKIKPSTLEMMGTILSHIEVRDLIQSKLFFDTLAKMDMSDFDYDAFGKSEFSNFDKIPNDLNILLKQIGFGGNLNVLRAICCVSIICHSNRLWQSNLDWFGDDEQKQIYRDPESVLHHIYKFFVIPNQRYEYDVYLENEQKELLIAMHSDPILPDDVDEYGQLPQLRCGWKKCAKVFTNRDRLLNHVQRWIPHVFVHRFHLKCGIVLEENPEMTQQQFMKRAMAQFDADKRKDVTEQELIAYYNQFQPILREQKCNPCGVKTSAPVPNIVSNGNPYYFDQLVKVKKF